MFGVLSLGVWGLGGVGLLGCWAVGVLGCWGLGRTEIFIFSSKSTTTSHYEINDPKSQKYCACHEKGTCSGALPPGTCRRRREIALNPKP